MASSVTPADQNAILVQLCVKVLKSITPNGMTTKELAAELDKEVDQPGFNGISSSILSSKLNAVFRRVHNDSPNPTQDQLAELPLTRAQSTDVPRRLVYRYTPPTSSVTAGSVTPKRRMSDASDGSVSPSLSSAESDGDNQNEPMTPKDETSTWSSAKRRRTNSEVPSVTSGDSDIPIPPDHRAPTPPNSSLKKLEQGPRVNLYYDMVGYDAMTAVFSPKFSPVTDLSESKHEHESWIEDVASPENLELNELDQMIC